jgi:23S rRNA pseudouridine1911/1915/1917 synthase
MTTDPRDGTFRPDAAVSPQRLDRAVKTFRPALSWGEARDLITRGKVTVNGVRATDPARPVDAACEITIAVAAPRIHKGPLVPPFPKERVLHQDRHVIVVDKPAGLPSVPWEDDPDALDRRLQELLGHPVQVVHRLDRDTTGAIMFALTQDAFAHLEHQLRLHTVHRRYLAIAHGDVKAQTIRSHIADNRGDGLRGSVHNARVGKEAVTHVEPVEPLRGATLVSCRLETGRTHQIRIHLAEQGHMLLGERGYIREHKGEAIPAPRILLHAHELGFQHPTTGEQLRFVSPLPADMEEMLASLR